MKACEDQQNGLLDAAKTGYLQLLNYFSEAPLLHYNLGLVYYEEKDYEKSGASFLRAAELAPEDMDILFNLGLTQKKSGDLQGAIESYLRIVSVEPESVDSLYNLAGCYKDSRQYPQAIESYLKLLELDPSHLAANNNLAYVYQVSGESERAIFYYQKVMDLHPEDLSAKHMLAALTGSDSTGSPESYVQEIFDEYSDHYEQSLVVELEYCVPTTLRRLLRQGGQGPGKQWQKSFAHGLDLGCGTGLSGQAFVDMVSVLDGVDLSKKMIALADAKNIYRNLYAGNIIDFLASCKESYDFFLAADVFAYLGDLAETFALLRRRASRDVLFCFSTETLVDDVDSPEGQGYHLQVTGRFAHEPGYVTRIAGATGWQVVARHSSSIRKEKGCWVKGDLWFLQLMAS